MATISFHLMVTSFLLAVSTTAQQCLPSAPCNATYKYRSTSGWCNNLIHPGKASTNTTFVRVLAAAYDDGIGIPRSKSVLGSDISLPLPRTISNRVHMQRAANEPGITHMLMQFGQFLDHDMTLTASAPATDPYGNSVNCAACNSMTFAPNCLPNPIPADDHFFLPTTNPDGTQRCLSLTRSEAFPTPGPRIQYNLNSHYIDGSQIYGSDDCRASSLRTMSGGLLKFTPNIMSTNPMALPQALPPLAQQGTCNSLPGHTCFVAGDIRNQEQPQIQVLHTLFLREHNRIAKQLALLQPSWNDERLFQESRRIVIAQLQHIAYNEYLPRIIGSTLWNSKGLGAQAQGRYFTGYDATCDASVLLPFNTAAYRFGHSLVRENIVHLTPKLKAFTNPFNNADLVYNETTGGINTMACGLLGKPIEKMDNGIVDALRNFLYSVRGNASTGDDLAARNIIRGRDHGLVPYNQWRAYCGLSKATTFADLSATVQAQPLRLLKTTYASVDDIDAWTGMISEIPVDGGVVGPTAACIIAQQFLASKKCDRFFYENDNANILFTTAQLDDIRQMTLSSLLCQNFPQDNIQPQAFAMNDPVTNPLTTSCTLMHKLNLAQFAV